MQGFICPGCMLTFNCPDELQIHFVMAHAEDGAEQGPIGTQYSVVNVSMKYFNEH